MKTRFLPHFRAFAGMLLFSTTALSCSTAWAQDDYYVTCLFNHNVIKVSAANGTRTVVSGPRLNYPQSIVKEPGSNNLYVSDWAAVYRVNVATNEVKMVSGPGVGTGPAFGGTSDKGIALDKTGGLVVTDSVVGVGAIFRVDPATGNRAIISGGSFPEYGSGPAFGTVTGIAVESNGNLLVVDYRLLRVNPLTGNRAVVSGGSPLVGTGPPFGSLGGIIVEPSGTIIVTSGSTVVRVDPVSGNRTIVSGSGVGTGPTITRLDGIVLESGGRLFVTDSFLDAVFSVDPTTGNRSMISGGRYPSAIGSGPGFGTAAGVVVESAASLVVVDNLYDNLIRVDRATGNRTYVPNISVGTGPGSGGWLSPTGIAMGRDGVLYVAVRIFPDELLIRVDPATGDRTIVSAGAGPELVSPKGVALERNGTLVVVDSFEGSVVRVDPLTGNLTTISGGWPALGSGPDFFTPNGIAVESNGKLVVTDGGLDAVLRVDPSNGNRSIVSDSSHGTGQPFSPWVNGIAVEANGSLVVSLQAFGGAIVRVNPVTGNRTIVSGGDPFSNTVGTGPDFIFPTGIAVLPNGTLVVVDGFHNVFRVNPLNGNRTLVSSDVVGAGPLLYDPEYVAVPPPPPPPTHVSSWRRYP